MNNANEANTEAAEEIDSYLTSMFNSLQEELINEFGTKEKQSLYYIYTRFQKQQKKLELFVRLNRNTEVNKTKSHLYFIITIDQYFPVNPPYVVFASDLAYPSLNDQRNLLTCLHSEWRSTSKVSTIINNMPTFLQAYFNDVEENLFVFYGAYAPLPHLYSINDFLSNSSNMLIKVKVILDMSKSIFEDYYIIITDVSLILFSIEANDKSKGEIAFMSELRMIDGILSMSLDKSNKAFEDKISFQLLWKEKAFSCDYGFIIDQNEFKDFQDAIRNRNSMLVNKFSLFMNGGNNSIETLQGVIKIKEAFLESVYDWYTFNSLLELYQNIIELSSNEKKGDIVTQYVQRLQLLLKKYKKTDVNNDKLK